MRRRRRPQPGNDVDRTSSLPSCTSRIVTGIQSESILYIVDAAVVIVVINCNRDCNCEVGVYCFFLVSDAWSCPS